MRERERPGEYRERERAVRGYGRRIEEDCDLGFVGERETETYTFVVLAVSS